MDANNESPTRIREMKFEAFDLAEPQRPEYQRLFDEYVLATIHLYLNGEELTHENKLPARFDLSDTVTAFHDGIESLFETGHDARYCFCCACGDRGCAYIFWETMLSGDEIHIEMKDGLGNSIGDRYYVVSASELLTAVIDLLETLTDFMRENDYREVSRGTITDFETKRDALREKL